MLGITVLCMRWGLPLVLHRLQLQLGVCTINYMRPGNVQRTCSR